MLLPESYLQPSVNRDPAKARGFIITLAILYPLYVIFLYWLWYSGTERTAFHIFDDAKEWQLMDKIGHFVVCFNWALMPTFVFCWAGYSPQKSALMSLGLSCIVLVPVEVMDGFSVAWGFSVWDMVANIGGALFAYIQLVGFKNIRIITKFSFHQTAIALLRPDMFGASYLQSSLKDYNGQTYWLSFDINKLTGKKILPSWLLISIGFGAEGMYGGHDNVWTDKTGQIQDYSHKLRYTQWFLSVDLNLSNHITHPVWKRVLYPINIFKVPMPTIEFNEVDGFKFHWLYY